jgi:polysaccharide pyruvyl transferase WcaK-like protein
MKVLLLNDTSKYHFGCAQVIKTFMFDDSITTDNYRNIKSVDYSQYDKVILNGEGTMHHLNPVAIQFLNGLRLAQKAGCSTELLNTVWQQMPEQKDVLQRCDKIVVRETLSQKELLKDGIESEVQPDRSMIIDPSYTKYDHVHIYRGQYFFGEYFDDYPRINIFKQSWNEIVNRLRHCDLLITGRHHEMYAAIKARCKFSITKGNSWKNEGLLKMFDLDINLTPKEILTGNYDEQYDKLFEYCNKYEK